MERPVGVTILAVLALVAGGLVALGGLLMVGGGAVAGAVGAATAGAGGGVAAVGGIFAMGMGVFMLLWAALSIAFGVGALQLRRWAWVLGIICEGLGVLMNLGNLMHGHAGGAIFGLVINGVILWYLFQPDVKRAFAIE